MSPLLWIQRLFVPQPDNEASLDESNMEQVGIPEVDSPIMSSQHIRIVLAIVFMFLSAIILWWILI